MNSSVVGIVLNAAGAAISYYLWTEDKDERYLLYWTYAWALGVPDWALRLYMADWPAVRLLDSLLVSVVLFFILYGCYWLLPAPRWQRPRTVGLTASILLLYTIGAQFTAYPAVLDYGLFVAVLLLCAFGMARSYWLERLGGYAFAAVVFVYEAVLVVVVLRNSGSQILNSALVPLWNVALIICILFIAHQRSKRTLRQLRVRMETLVEEERRHLSRELHDEFGQLLAAMALHLHAAKAVAGDVAQSNLDEGIALVQRAGAQTRTLALELRPTMLEASGLDTTLRWLAEGHQQRTGIATEVTGYLGDVPGDRAITCFRVIQEALTNVARHARAQHVWIDLSHGDGALELVVRDDGVGFDLLRAKRRAMRGERLGLLGMQERVAILDGDLKIDSQPGRGTQIRISLPWVEHTTAPP